MPQSHYRFITDIRQNQPSKKSHNFLSNRPIVIFGNVYTKWLQPHTGSLILTITVLVCYWLQQLIPIISLFYIDSQEELVWALAVNPQSSFLGSFLNLLGFALFLFLILDRINIEKVFFLKEMRPKRVKYRQNTEVGTMQFCFVSYSTVHPLLAPCVMPKFIVEFASRLDPNGFIQKPNDIFGLSRAGFEKPRASIPHRIAVTIINGYGFCLRKYFRERLFFQ